MWADLWQLKSSLKVLIFQWKVLNDSLSVIREFTMRNLITNVFFSLLLFIRGILLYLYQNKLHPLDLTFLLIVLDRQLQFVFYILYVCLNVLLGLSLLIQPVYTILWHDHEFLRYVLLHFQVQCPFSIVLSGKTLTDFFALCHCKHINYQLCGDVANVSSQEKTIPFIFSLLAYFMPFS